MDVMERLTLCSELQIDLFKDLLFNWTECITIY